MTTLELWTLGIAITGLFLGIRSAWRDYSRDRVRIRVVPKVAYPAGGEGKVVTFPGGGRFDGRPHFAIDIINAGAFPVTVREVGFRLAGRDKWSSLVPLVDRGPWPRRLESHDGLTLYSPAPEELGLDVRMLRGAYATTSEGRTFTGTSKAIKTVARRGAIPPCPRPLAEMDSSKILTLDRV